MSIWDGKVVEFTYENHRGVTEVRRVVPTHVWFGSTEYYPKKQWLLSAWCLERQARRDFTFEAISGWAEAEDQSLPWRMGETPAMLTHRPPEPGYGPAPEQEPLDFPSFKSGEDEMNVQLVPGATYRVTTEQARKYDKTFRRLGIKTIEMPPGK